MCYCFFLCVVGNFFTCFFLKNNNRAPIIVLEDLAALRRVYKNYQLLLIYWLAGYWSPEAGWSLRSGWVVDVSLTGWN